MRARDGLLFALTMTATTFVGRDSRASVSFTVVFDALLEESTAAAVATAMDEHSVWEDGRIVTYTHARIDDVLAGGVGRDVWIRALGGEVDDIGQQVEGEATFVMGHRYMVFLKPNAQNTMSVVARAQGEFPLVAADAKTLRVPSTLRAVALPPRADVVLRLQSRAPEAAQPAGAVLAGKSVEEMRTLVLGAWSRTHASGR